MVVTHPGLDQSECPFLWVCWGCCLGRMRITYKRITPDSYHDHMAGSAEAKISGVLQREVDLVEKECMRPLQVRAFKCSIRCCEDQTSPQTVVQSCVQGCMAPMMKAESRIKGEVDQLQDRLSRCAQQCKDEIQDLLPANPTQQDTEQAKQKGEACLMKCADSHMHLIPKMIARYRASLGSCS